MRPVTHRAAAIAATAVFAATAHAALQPPDLSLTLTGSAGTVNASGQLSYSLTVKNTAVYGTICSFDPDTHRRVCEVEPVSANAAGVLVRAMLPAGVQVLGVSGDSGFTCTTAPSGSGTLATCANGFIYADDAGHITLQVKMPNAGGSFTTTAAADPLGAIAERNESNNNASITTAVNPPPNTNLPDLNCSETTPTSTFDGRSPVDFSVFLRNSGPVTATNVTLTFSTPYTNGLLGLSVGNGFSCRYLSAPNQSLQVQCDGGTIAAFGSAFMTVRISPDGQLPSGTPFTLATYMDPYNQIPDLYRPNNNCTKAVIVSP